MEIIIKKQPQTIEDQKWDRRWYFVFNLQNIQVAKFALVTWNQSNSIEIFNLEVKKQFQNQQIGKQIIAFIKKTNLPKSIWAFANFSAVVFYQKLGFKFCQDFKNQKYFGQDRKTILMALTSSCLFIDDSARILKFTKGSKGNFEIV